MVFERCGFRVNFLRDAKADANAHVTSFAYDAFGRVSKTTFPSTLAEYYYYDAVGNLVTKTDRKSQTINYTYDQLNRLVQKLYPDSTAVNYTSHSFLQDSGLKKCDSRLTQVTDPTGTYAFTFDNALQLPRAFNFQPSTLNRRHPPNSLQTNHLRFP